MSVSHLGFSGPSNTEPKIQRICGESKDRGTESEEIREEIQEHGISVSIRNTDEVPGRTKPYFLSILRVIISKSGIPS